MISILTYEAQVDH